MRFTTLPCWMATDLPGISSHKASVKTAEKNAVGRQRRVRHRLVGMRDESKIGGGTRGDRNFHGAM